MSWWGRPRPGGDRPGPPGTVAVRPQDRHERLQEEVAVLFRPYLIEGILVFTLGVEHVCQGTAHPVDLGEVAVLRSQDPAPEPDLPLTQRLIGHLEDHGEHVLVDEEVLASKLEVVLEPFKVEEKGIAADADEKFVVPALHDPGVTVEGHRHVPEEDLARDFRGPRLFARGASHGGLLVAVLPPGEGDAVGDVGYRIAVRVEDELVDRLGRERVRQRRRHRIHAHHQDGPCWVCWVLEGEDIGDIYPRVHVRRLQAWGIEMVGHILLLARKLSFRANPGHDRAAGVSPSSNQVCYMIAIIRRVTATQHPTNPTVNASVSTSAAPRVVSRLLLGAPASVRPICFSIIVNFLSSTSLGACADRLATLYVCRFPEQSDYRPLDRIEDAG